MTVRVHKKFLKDLSGLPEKERKRVEDIVFNSSPKCKHYTELPGITKLKGFTDFYKIRVGNYRIGISISGDTVIFERVLHRKEIYRYYP
jgi:mRNA interferase RelE/StbE